nr:nucleotidyltransferase family protein [Ruminococcus sp.]
MERKEYITAVKDVIYLTYCAVNKRKPNENRLKNMELTEVFTAAQNHMLTAACATALESAGINDKEFTQAKAKAMRKNAQMDIDRAMLLAELEKEGIWYMPLKGTVLKDYYPTYGMRQMSDNDILFDSTRAADVRRIMESLGFTAEKSGASNHDIYFKQPVSNFEMHTGLFDIRQKEQIYGYFTDVKERLVKDEDNSFGYHFSDEDFYIFITAHEYKHYSKGGTGLRSLLDIYVYMNRFADKLDFGYIEAECEKLGIADFEKQTRRLATDLFGGKNPTEEDKEMLKYIALSGTYGN